MDVSISCDSSDQAKALHHIDDALRRAKLSQVPTIEPVSLDHVAIVGGGDVAASLACALLMAGVCVTVIVLDLEEARATRARIQRISDQLQQQELIDGAQIEDRKARLTVSTDHASVAGAALLIEATGGAQDAVCATLGQFQCAMSDATILATTSGFDPHDIAECVADPTRLLGFHLCAPVHSTGVVEVSDGPATGDAARATGFALARKLRKVPVRTRGSGGSIANRLLARYHDAADTVFMDGSTPWEVDEAMVEFGFAMGPYEAQDQTGVDYSIANRRRVSATRDPKRRHIPIADRMLELGKLGRKTGAGWYRYPGGGGKVDDPIVADLALEEAHFAGIARTDYRPDEIRARLLFAMINEAADILDEGMARSTSDVDLVSVLGLGFPRWRGGLMYFADTLGAKAIVDGLNELAHEDPLAWKPSPLLLRSAQSGGTIAQAMSS